MQKERQSPDATAALEDVEEGRAGLESSPSAPVTRTSSVGSFGVRLGSAG